MTLSRSSAECRILIYVLIIFLAILSLILGIFLDILTLTYIGIAWLVWSIINILFLLIYISNSTNNVNRPLLPVNNNKEQEKLQKLKKKPNKELLDKWKITRLLYLSKCENIDEYKKMENILNEFKDEDFIDEESYLIKFNKIKFKL